MGKIAVTETVNHAILVDVREVENHLLYLRIQAFFTDLVALLSDEISRENVVFLIFPSGES